MEEQGWTESDSAQFIDDGRYFVPEREEQIDTICAVLPLGPTPGVVVELCCGEGLLTGAILERFPAVRVIALDGSPAMLEATAARNARWGDRLDTRRFELADADWRRFAQPLDAVVSSLAIHHLDGAGKRALFGDLARALAPGGALVIADLVAPTTAEAVAWAARSWDREVRRRARDLDGHEAAFERFRAERWNLYGDPAGADPIDQPSSLWDQLAWLREAGFAAVDVHWMKAGHAIFSGRKRE